MGAYWPQRHAIAVSATRSAISTTGQLLLLLGTLPAASCYQDANAPGYPAIPHSAKAVTCYGELNATCSTLVLTVNYENKLPASIQVVEAA